jgi:hypothetical protein
MPALLPPVGVKRTGAIDGAVGARVGRGDTEGVRGCATSFNWKLAGFPPWIKESREYPAPTAPE